MPYRWLPPSPARPQIRRLWLTPHQSLDPEGFAWFIGSTALLIALPLLAVSATPVFWGLLPFILIPLAAIWFALQRSWRDRSVTETLELGPGTLLLRHSPATGTALEWQVNSYWVTVQLYPTGGPVEDYLTLRADGREVELGAFLTPEERRSLAAELREGLRAARKAQG